MDYDIIGSDIADKTGWDKDTMLTLYCNFIAENALQDRLLDYLNKVADEELAEILSL